MTDYKIPDLPPLDEVVEAFERNKSKSGKSKKNKLEERINPQILTCLIRKREKDDGAIQVLGLGKVVCEYYKCFKDDDVFWSRCELTYNSLEHFSYCPFSSYASFMLANK